MELEFNNYEEWLKQVPEQITKDTLWRMQVYKVSLFLSDLCWFDVKRIIDKKKHWTLADQLYRATGSISANIAEGYSRRSGIDRSRFLEYSLGSARESRDWYYKSRFLLSNKVVEHRLALLEEIIKILLSIIPDERKSSDTISEPETQIERDHENNSFSPHLLEGIPFS